MYGDDAFQNMQHTNSERNNCRIYLYASMKEINEKSVFLVIIAIIIPV